MFVTRIALLLLVGIPLETLAQSGDVRAFGASGDGLTDDSAAIASAVGAAIREGGSVSFPRGTYRFGSTLQLGHNNLHVVCEPGAVLRFTGMGVAVAFANSAPAAASNVGMDNCTIEGNPAATDGILLQRAHHVSFRNVSVRNVPGACLRTKFSVVGEYTNFRCTATESPLVISPANGIVLGSDGAHEETTASTFVNAIVECVTADGIVLDAAANIVFTAGTSENNHHGWGMTIGPNSNNITVIGMDFEDNALGSVQSSGTENVFLNILSTGLFRVRAGGRGNTIANSRVNQVTFDAGSYNNIMRENDYAIENGRAEPIDSGANNSIYANYNAANHRYAQGYVRFPVDPSAAGSIVAAAAAAEGSTPYRVLRVGSEWSDIGTVPSSAWRAVFIGAWDGAGTTLTEVSADSPAAEVAGAPVAFQVDPITARLRVRTDGRPVRFAGAVFTGAR